MELLVRKNHHLRSSNGGRFEIECLKRLLGDVSYLSDVLYKYEIAFRNRLKPLCFTWLTLFQEHKETNVNLNFLASKEESS
jgi:hypothetical protein